MTEIERKQKIYQEWLEEAQRTIPTKRADEFSTTDFAKEANIGKDYARKLIAQKLKDGLIVERKTTRGTFYSLV